ncbi:MAG: ATP-binding protein [Chloroflexota bacterium]|nr:adenine nucleotide alpha hydrolase [Chloroflexota bacterium]MBI5705145.1 adenine nucleotide alpha hydrolase [Chloroflexota bacterium]
MSSYTRILLSWSSGKDSAWALHTLRRQRDVEIVGLLTTFNETNNRVAMHGVRMELVKKQAEAAGVPLWSVPLPFPCSNEEYEARMRAVIERARREGVTHVAFGDLFLEDIRAYRERMMTGTGIQPLFPLWRARDDTKALADEMLAGGLRAALTTIDPKQLDPTFAGRMYDERLLAELPASVDPCGENGEFHTFCFAGPMFEHPIPIRVGEIVTRDGFVFSDLLPAA